MLRSNSSSDWIVVRARNPEARLRLLCFPYAGGGAGVFSTWSSALPSEVEVSAVQMPGREWRVGEPPVSDLGELIEQLSRVLLQWTDRPYAFFGHSLGALLAFELARRICRKKRPGFVHLFVSGRGAPHLPPDGPLIHALPDNEFMQEIGRFAGTPEEILQDRELMEIFMPVLRADFKLGETYTYEEDLPLTVPVSAYGGVKDESVLAAKVEEWRRHTSSTFRRVMFPGGHFFLHENGSSVLSQLAGELRAIVARLKRYE